MNFAAGAIVNNLTILDKAPERLTIGKYTMLHFWCKCVCGKEILVQRSNLARGQKSCGCLHRAATSRRMKKSDGTATSNHVMAYYKKNATRRKLSWELDANTFETLIKQPCHYCKSPGRISTKHKDSLLHNGIDRIDNSIGYTIDNCVPCCSTCNFAKNELTVEEFRAWAMRLYENFVTC